MFTYATSRYALNFKTHHGGLQYETSWTELSKVTEVRKSLGALPVRKHFIDDSDFYTLPVIVDQSADGKKTTVGDSFDIAVYLDKTYPSRAGEPVLLPDRTVALHRAFNTLADTIFPEHALLVLNVPFNPETEHIVKKEFLRRVPGNLTDWSQLQIEGKAREALLVKFESRLGELAKLYTKRGEGPFLEGKVPMYADMIVGGWLQWLVNACPEWDRVKKWHGGLWETVHEGLSVYAQVD